MLAKDPVSAPKMGYGDARHVGRMSAGWSDEDWAVSYRFQVAPLWLGDWAESSNDDARVTRFFVLPRFDWATGRLGRIVERSCESVQVIRFAPLPGRGRCRNRVHFSAVGLSHSFVRCARVGAPRKPFFALPIGRALLPLAEREAYDDGYSPGPDIQQR
jgi:hypothetical protein